MTLPHESTNSRHPAREEIQSEASPILIKRLKPNIDGDLMSGKLFFAPDTEIRGLVIFLHGLGYCPDVYNLDRSIFPEKGYPFLEYSIRGHSNSQGAFTTMGAVRDIAKWIDETWKEMPELVGKPIGILGHSVGALVGLLAAMDEPRVTYASISSVVTSMQESFLHWFDSDHIANVKKFYTHDGVLHPALKKLFTSKESLKHFIEGSPSREDLSFPERYGFMRTEHFYDFFCEVAYSPNIFDDLWKVKLPVILFKNIEDEIIPSYKTEELYWKLRTKQKKLIGLNAKEHFLGRHWRMICQESERFFSSIHPKKHHPTRHVPA